MRHADVPRPLTALDIDRDRSGRAFDMHEPMADMCPSCGGNTMIAGDYVCWGACYRCFCDEQFARAVTRSQFHEQ